MNTSVKVRFNGKVRAGNPDKWQADIKKINALDAGSGPGGSTFEFANYFKQVEAFDYSKNFVTALLQKKDEYKKPNVIAF